MGGRLIMGVSSRREALRCESNPPGLPFATVCLLSCQPLSEPS